MPTHLLGPELQQPELDDTAGRCRNRFPWWVKGLGRGITPLTAPQLGRAMDPSRVLPQRCHAGNLGFHVSCLVWPAPAHVLGVLQGASVWLGCRRWDKAWTDRWMGQFCLRVTSASVFKISMPFGFCCAVNYVTEHLQLHEGSCWIIWITVSKTTLAERAGAHPPKAGLGYGATKPAFRQCLPHSC